MTKLKTPFDLLTKLTICTCIFTSSCETKPDFKEYEKENDIGTTKYEVPYNQFRNKPESVDNPDDLVKNIPTDNMEKPEVIKPSDYGNQIPIPFGILVKSKPGFILSPYAPDKGLVDVREYPPGTQVTDPYTGKIIKTPFSIEDKKQTQAQEKGTTITTLSDTNTNQPDTKGPPSIE